MILSACPRGKAKQWAPWYLCASEMERARCRSLYNTPARRNGYNKHDTGWAKGAPSYFPGLPPHEDHASNLVGPVRDIIELLGGRRLFQAVRHIGPKWATCMPGTPQRVSLTPRTRGARSARTSLPQRARAACASEGV
eukprot:scaffold9982_cov63-Phaeocystis_antarctica.AAC.7